MTRYAWSVRLRRIHDGARWTTLVYAEDRDRAADEAIEAAAPFRCTVVWVKLARLAAAK